MAKIVALAPKLDSAASVALRNEILAAVKEDIVFDCAVVEQIGGQCLELLMSTVSLWSKAGFSVSLENPSLQMIDDLKRLGLTPDTLLESAV